MLLELFFWNFARYPRLGPPLPRLKSGEAAQLISTMLPGSAVSLAPYSSRIIVSAVSV
jgi:hypothetical protein